MEITQQIAEDASQETDASVAQDEQQELNIDDEQISFNLEEQVAICRRNCLCYTTHKF